MQKLFVFILFLISPGFLFGQQKGSIIKLISATRVTGEPKNNIMYYINPVFQQDNATLSSDSAVFYTKRNYFEAFKNVHIQQLETDIKSDALQYDGNKKQAHLTGNVEMRDPKSVLTTNILDYSTASKIGTYTSGGKIVTQDVTLTSKNGYYFSNSSDSYFKYNVLVVTPQSTITSDTMRYNLDTKWTYFYGPTNIKGKDDNLYTENGAYNTLSEDAYFGKKNLYTQGTKSLKGDSLYYYGKIGYGKAVKNIVFTDKKDGTKMYGDLGFYYKIDQRTLVTINAFVDLVTKDSVVVGNKKTADTLRLGADTLETQMVLQKSLKLIPKISIKADNEIGEDDIDGEQTAVKSVNNLPGNNKGKAVLADVKNEPDEKKKQLKEKITSKDIKSASDSVKHKADPVKIDLVKNKADSLLQKEKIKEKTDSLAKSLTKIKTDSLQRSLIKKTAKDSLGKTIANLKPGLLKPDSVINPADTITTRIIKAYHNVKIYKSNIQAKTDSLFYTSADSTLRCYGNPIIWSDGSQVIGDTIYVQFKMNKLNNLQAFKNAFMVNTPQDSLRFNQIKGRYMTGFFSEGKLKTLYVDGNAESIYYTQDDSTKVYKEMNQTLSSRIKFVFKNSDIEDIVYINSIEGALNPEVTIAKDHVLKGFSWKPTERPKSKKEAIGSANKPKPKGTPVKKPENKDKVLAAKVATNKPISNQKTVASTTVFKAGTLTDLGIRLISTPLDSLNQALNHLIKL